MTTSASCSIEPDSRRSDELRPLVLALLDRARQLRQRQHRHVQLLGDRLQALGDLGDLLHPVFRLAPVPAASAAGSRRRAAAEPVAALQPARAGAQGRDRERRRVVDVQRHGAPAPGWPDHASKSLVLGDVAAPQTVGLDPALGGQQARRELLGRHLEREDADAVVGCWRGPRLPRRLSAAAAALAAIVIASAVLPMLGRPARITRSDGCSPPSFSSRSVSPVGTPVTRLLLCSAASTILTVLVSTCGKARKPPSNSPVLGQLEQLALGGLDLSRGRVSVGSDRRPG